MHLGNIGKYHLLLGDWIAVFRGFKLMEISSSFPGSRYLGGGFKYSLR